MFLASVADEMIGTPTRRGALAVRQGVAQAATAMAIVHPLEGYTRHSSDGLAARTMLVDLACEPHAAASWMSHLRLREGKDSELHKPWHRVRCIARGV